METKSIINDFVSQKNIAVLGVSRNSKKFGNYIYRHLRERGYNVYPVNPNTDVIEGDNCYRTISELPESVSGVILNIPPQKSLSAIDEISEKGIKKVWLQQGSSNKDVTKKCSDLKMDFIENQCIIMYSEPVESFHKFHRWIWKLIGKYQN
ncbi:MAG: CoA-binding protein [Melioribacteraceae bacterium]|nr:CoA-binding protein [Melioribacteraceae bacterium]MCF8353217.1 CoA-binding protein [Melioribacteraceae bacterium]MCF8395608.1 CoA-binding protein [Melioribacteraceae bacterium]MCF8418749.1 CoA-binding protein [Melioribacteraceae bacterium]